MAKILVLFSTGIPNGFQKTYNKIADRNKSLIGPITYGVHRDHIGDFEEF